MINQISKAERVTIPAYSANVSGGACVLAGSIFGVAVASILAGDDLVLETCGGFESVPKATGETWAVGDPLYWSATNSNLTKTATNNKLVASAIVAAASADTIGAVRIGYPIIV